MTKLKTVATTVVVPRDQAADEGIIEGVCESIGGDGSLKICVAQVLFANIFPQMVAAIVLEKVTFSGMRSNSES